jgi:hypothetical protein
VKPIDINPVFLLIKFRQKKTFEILIEFSLRVSMTRSEKEIKSRQISIFGFLYVAKTMEG